MRRSGAVISTILCLISATLSQEREGPLIVGGARPNDVAAQGDTKTGGSDAKQNLVWKRPGVMNQLKQLGGREIENNPHLDTFLAKHAKPEIFMEGDNFFLQIDRRYGFKPKIRLAPFRSFAEPWPLPREYTSNRETVFHINPASFQIQILNKSSDILQEAIKRYTEIVAKQSLEEPYSFVNNYDKSFEKYNEDDAEKYKRATPLPRLAVYVSGSDVGYPHLNMDETYSLAITRNEARLDAAEVWGALRGLETFSQIVYRRRADQQLYVREAKILDSPRFQHRGILVDTARHYMHKSVLLQMMEEEIGYYLQSGTCLGAIETHVLDAMACNKLNVLHWHIVDDNAFPYASEVYPNLSAKGAAHPTSVYTLKDIRDLVEYARLRGIRIVPEFDSPGHTLSWLGYPEIKSTCYSGTVPLNGPIGPIDPVKNETYTFMRNLFKEIYNVFPDQYVHLGGDELHSECWAYNPSIVKFLQDQAQIPPPSRSNARSYVDQAVGYYFKRLIENLKDAGKERKNGASFIMWQDVLKNTKAVPKDSILQVWMGPQTNVRDLNNKGYKALFSSCWYLDHTYYGTDWLKYYKCEPSPYAREEEDKGKLLGGEACMWAEYITSDTLMTTTWPRASAAAERLWSRKNVVDIPTALKRFQEHRCRMVARGIRVGHSMGPDHCVIGEPPKAESITHRVPDRPDIVMNIGHSEIGLTMLPEQSKYLPVINLALTCIGIYLMVMASRLWRNKYRSHSSPSSSPKFST